MYEIGIGSSKLQLLSGDITKQDSEAVVNAANKHLAPGGGVAGAIHRAAGPRLGEECGKLGGCETGQAKISSGYNLPNKYVIHTVGPVYGQAESAAGLLRDSYLNSLKLAENKGIRSISFPALSTGAFGYPLREASQIALQTIVDYLKGKTSIELVRMVLYDQSSFDVHKEVLEEIVRV